MTISRGVLSHGIDGAESSPEIDLPVCKFATCQWTDAGGNRSLAAGVCPLKRRRGRKRTKTRIRGAGITTYRTRMMPNIVTASAAGACIVVLPSALVANWSFVTGWHIDAGGGKFKLLAPVGGRIDVITARGGAMSRNPMIRFRGRANR